MEGLYLHNLIFRALFTDSNSNITHYIVLGWGKDDTSHIYSLLINLFVF